MNKDKKKESIKSIDSVFRNCKKFIINLLAQSE